MFNIFFNIGTILLLIGAVIMAILLVNAVMSPDSFDICEECQQNVEE